MFGDIQDQNVIIVPDLECSCWKFNLEFDCILEMPDENKNRCLPTIIQNSNTIQTFYHYKSMNVLMYKFFKSLFGFRKNV